MRKTLALITLLSILLSACGTATPAPGLPTPTTGLASAPPTSAPAESSSSGTGGSETLPTSAPTAAPPATAPAIKTDFTPTDPTTVNLAAGKPQFVEFFAFW